jgi:hypothetical protein
MNLCSGRFSLHSWTSIILVGEILPSLKDQLLIWVRCIQALGNSSTSSIWGSPKTSVFVLSSLPIMDILPLFNWISVKVTNVIVKCLDVEFMQYLTINTMLTVSALMMIMDMAMLAVFTLFLGKGWTS